MATWARSGKGGMQAGMGVAGSHLDLRRSWLRQTRLADRLALLPEELLQLYSGVPV